MRLTNTFTDKTPSRFVFLEFFSEQHSNYWVIVIQCCHRKGSGLPYLIFIILLCVYYNTNYVYYRVVGYIVYSYTSFINKNIVLYIYIYIYMLAHIVYFKISNEKYCIVNFIMHTRPILMRNKIKAKATAICSCYKF